MKTQWWHKSIIYQIYPKSFYDANHDGIGDLEGIIAKLDYLQDLGIDVIWLSPVYQSPMADNGYDISDYYAIAKEFGTMSQMEQLLKEAKQRNIRIIMDLVVNHTSDEHGWFLESKSSRTNPKRNWYIWRDPKPDGSPPNNWGSVFGGSAWEYDSLTAQYYLHVFSKKQPDLNWENPEVREAIYKMIHWWLNKGISGFRVDAITYIKKDQSFASILSITDGDLPLVSGASLNQPGIEKFLAELKFEAFNDELITVAEAPGVSFDDLSKYAGENGYFSMIFSFDHVDWDLGNGGKWYKYHPDTEWFLNLKRVIRRDQNYYNQTGWNAIFLENHDSPRSLNKFIKHDDISVLSAKMLAIFYFLLRGTPFIYQGEEIGMTNVAYPSIKDYDDISSLDQYQAAIRDGYSQQDAMKAVWRRSRDNARTPMQWNDQYQAGFSDCTPWLKVNPNYQSINVERCRQDPRSLLYFYKKLIWLRKESSYSDVLTYGEYQALWEEDPDIFGYLRLNQRKKLLVMGNFHGFPRKVNIPFIVTQMVLSNYTDFCHESILRPYEAMVLELAVDKEIQ